MRMTQLAVGCFSAISLITVSPLVYASTSTTTSLTVTASGSHTTSVAAQTVVTFQATVAAGATPLTSGQVNVCDATAAYCTDIHLLATIQLTSAGNAMFRFVPGPGNHSYKAVFLGTNTYTGSSSTASALTVTASQVYPSTTTIASTGTPGNYTLNATVTGAGASNSPAPTGTVSFLDTTNAGVTLGMAALSSGTAGLNFMNKPIAISGVVSPAAGDFNGDGKPDLVLVNESGGPISILLGNGDGTFTTGASVQNTPYGAYAATVGDFNGDGKSDLLVESFNTSAGSGSIVAFLGNGDGTFSAATASAINSIPSQFAVSDFNHDGIADVAVLTGTGLVILVGNGDGTFSPGAASPMAIGSDANQYLALGDFNGDGKADLAAIGESSSNAPNQANSAITVLLGNGDGSFTVGPSFTTCCNAAGLIGVDFNGDGKTDIATAVTDYMGILGNTALELNWGNGDGTFASALYVGLGVSADGRTIESGDFDGDGNTDLAITYTESAPVTILTGNGSGGIKSTLSTPVTSADNSAIADFDGSGSSDLALSAGTIELTQPTQTATAAVNSIAPAGPGIHQVTASYPGDSVYGGSVSSPIGLTGSPTAVITFSVPNHNYGDAPFTVAARSNSTGAFTYSVTSGPATIAGATVTLTGPGTAVLQASQAAAGGYQTATQSASFTVDPALLIVAVNNAARVFGAANPAFTGTLSGAVNGDTFTETFSTPATAASIVGTYSITANATGPNVTRYTVVPGSATLTITQAGSATTFALSNLNETLTATVASLTSGTPTGTVNFYEGQTLVGSGTLSNGVASYTSSSFPAGDVLVSAQYSGDANFTQSSSPSILVLSVAPAAASLTVSSAGIVTDTVSLSPAPGYVGEVQLSCSGLPANATCSFQPSSVAFAGSSNTATSAVTIQTGLASQAHWQSTSPAANGRQGGIILAAFGIPGLITVSMVGRGRRIFASPLRQRVVSFLLLGGLCAGLSACGGSSASSVKPSSTSTPVGTYAVQIHASGPGGLSQTAAVTLMVQ